MLNRHKRLPCAFGSRVCLASKEVVCDVHLPRVRVRVRVMGDANPGSRDEVSAGQSSASDATGGS